MLRAVSLLIPTLCSLAAAAAVQLEPSRADQASSSAAVPRPTPTASAPHRLTFGPAIPAAQNPAAGARPRTIVPPGPPPKILPLSEVRPGMIGEALTVFQGTRPERFKVRVISVMRQFLPKQDVILIRAEDPRVEFSGIVAGMSGSPVYVDGKLMGAIAYAWTFSKEPICGVTPIESMLAERKRPRRLKNEFAFEKDVDGIRMLTMAEGGAGAPGAAASTSPTTKGTASSATSTSTSAASAFDPAWGSMTALPPRQAHLVPVAVPLSVAGFDPRVVADLARELSPLGLVPVQSGGGRRKTTARSAAGHVEPGSAIGIELVRGDMSMVGTGTVSYVDREGVLAFGHPMFGAGEIYLPLVETEIHAVLPSMAQSMKLSSPLGEVGALTQDRQSCVIGDLGARATMVPITIRVTGPNAAARTFHAEVARNRRLTPMLASLVVSNALVDAEPDVTDMVATVVSKIELRGRARLELRDEIFSSEGISRQSLVGTRGLRAVSDLLSNPFEPVVLDRLDIDIGVEYRRDVVEIVGVALPGDAVHPGETIALRVSLRPYAGAEYVETVPVVIPRSLGGDVARIEVASGAIAKPDMPAAETLGIMLDNLRRYYAPSSIVVSVQTPDDGAALRGRLIPDLPSAAADTLRPANQTRRADAYRIAHRTVFPTKRLVSGKQEISVYVRDEVFGEDKSRVH